MHKDQIIHFQLVVFKHRFDSILVSEEMVHFPSYYCYHVCVYYVIKVVAADLLYQGNVIITFPLVDTFERICTTFKNIMAKAKIAHKEQFLHLPQCFQLFSIITLSFDEIFHIFKCCRFVVSMQGKGDLFES